jgi:hypothetical protein
MWHYLSLDFFFLYFSSLLQAGLSVRVRVRVRLRVRNEYGVWISVHLIKDIYT